MDKFARTTGSSRALLGAGLVLTLLFLPLRPSSAADDALDTMLAGLAQHPHAQVSFSEETHSQLLTHDLHSTGVLRFDAPDRLEKQTLTPTAEDLIVEGDTATIIRGHHQSSIRLSEYPQLSSLLEGIRATLSGNRAALDQRFQLAFAVAGPGWELRLAPPPTTPHPGFKLIVLRGHGDALDNVALDQSNGDHTTIVLSPPQPG